MDNEKKTVVYQKGGCVFAFNFHPVNSYDGLWLDMPEEGEYEVVLSTDDLCFGGQGRIAHQSYQTEENGFKIYLPSRTAVVLKKKK